MKEIKELTLLAILSAIVFSLKQALAFLPNIQLVTFLFILYSRTIGTKRTLTAILSAILLFGLVWHKTPIKAYWASNISTAEVTTSISITIGEWNFTIEILEDWDLNYWQQNNTLNQTIPEGQLFIYNNIVYVAKKNYNPEWHGLPSSSNIWAFVPIGKEWYSGNAYQINRVVTYQGKYYISQQDYNIFDLSLKWAWREIEPISDEVFERFENGLINYVIDPTSPYLVYKT